MTRLSLSTLAVFLLSPATGLGQSPDSDIAGNWVVTINNLKWTVQLGRDRSKEKPGDDPVYCGIGTREEKLPDGRVATQEICASRNRKEAKLSLLAGGGVIACEAPFKDDGEMSGKCVFANSRELMFAAVRAAASPP